MKIKGILTVMELEQKIANEEIETVILAFTDHYGRLMGKRYDAEFLMEIGLKAGTHACNYLLTTDMEMEPIEGYDFANWEAGYGDFHLIPDTNTIRTASWLEDTAIIICDVEANHQTLNEIPRTILTTQAAKAKKLGFETFAASELEYYLFETSYRQANENHYHGLNPAGWYLEDYHILQGSRTEGFTGEARRHLKYSGVPVENSKGEWGKGQHELNVQYAQITEMADRHVIYKQCLKELADQMGLAVTFMAKIDEAQAGSSCHIHMSLWNGGKNVFYDKDKKDNCSDTFKWFLGGWIKYTGDVMPFFAPTINSYKRFADASWAPTRLAWSADNRTAGFRVVGEGQSLRIECRIPGADCNPYLAFAGLLACGLQGLEEKIDPPEAFDGDVYAAKHLPAVPATLPQAVEKFENSKFAINAFGEQVVKHYSHFYRKEIEAFEKSVTDWERKRYFERI